MRKGLRAATGGGIYDLMDAQASRQDQSVQARNREEQPYPGAMSQNMPGMAAGGRIARLARMVTGQRAQGRPVKKLTQDYPEMQHPDSFQSPGAGRYFARSKKEEQVRRGKADAKLRKRGKPLMTAEEIPFAGGGAVKLAANRVKAMRRFLARGPKSELLPRSARQKTAAATGAGLVGAKAAGDVIAEHTGPGAKMNYRNMHKNAAEAPMVNPLKFKYHDPSTWPKKAHGGELSIKAIKRLKPFRAKGKITPNDPPETMRYGGKFRARLKR